MADIPTEINPTRSSGKRMRAVQIDAHPSKQRGVDLKMQVHSTALKCSQSIDVHGIDGLTRSSRTPPTKRAPARDSSSSPLFALAVWRSKNSRKWSPLCCEGWSRRSIVWPFPPERKENFGSSTTGLPPSWWRTAPACIILSFANSTALSVTKNSPTAPARRTSGPRERARAALASG